jgi:hypothetical protein
MREMFFAPKIVLVEGLEDVAYITSALLLSGRWEEWRSGGAQLVPVGGKSELVQPLAIAQLLSIPVFVIFDADGNETRPDPRNLHKLDNERLLKLLGGDPTVPFPAAAIKSPTHIIWSENIGKLVELDFAPAEWAAWKSTAEAEHGNVGGLGKNSLFIASMMENAWNDGKPSRTLVDLCENLLKFSSI